MFDLDDAGKVQDQTALMTKEERVGCIRRMLSGRSDCFYRICPQKMDYAQATTLFKLKLFSIQLISSVEMAIITHYKTQEKHRQVEEQFGVSLNILADDYTKKLGAFQENLKLIDSREDAMFKTNRPNLYIVENMHSTMPYKFLIGKKDKTGACNLALPDINLFPGKKQVSLKATLEKEGHVIVYSRQKHPEAQTEANLFGDVTQVHERFDVFVNGDREHTIRIFGENGLMEERIIEESKATPPEGRELDFVIKGTDGGTEVSVKYVL